eukprot:TRINITY_DN2886_c0_g1_i2.p1 TRINITY_DN2886_c0_g1~~TRINITY_DN2886_c0_g1_i2.p1  ORF type:complete len:134 (-),score=25.83 TRINITY_DN2886_c0_g1_i2:113-514(-)
MFLSRVLRCASTPLAPIVKTSTGIVGLEVEPNAREILQKIYRQTLRDLKAVPETALYRKLTEELTKTRLSIVEKETDLTKIEELIAGGQVEELIEKAKDELDLIPFMVEGKPWEVDPLCPPKIIFIKPNSNNP